MEPQPKRRRLDVPAMSHDVGRSSGESQNTSHGHMSSTFDGIGISSSNGNFNVEGDLSINYNLYSQKTDTSNARQTVLESLRFEQIDARHLSIKKAHANTCRWFSQTQIYKQWEEKGPLRSDNFLWIKGKPGAGKSTLMKFLLGQRQTQLCQKKSSDVLISFFFNARGNDLEKSTTGLYRSLLWQLLNMRPELQHILDTLSPGHQWIVESLKSLFEEAVQGLGETPVICLIDALDECDELQVRNMVLFLNGLIDTGTALYICFASRHYPHITIERGLSIILEERDEHQHDIATYLSSTLHIGHSKLAEQIRADLQEKASGVFMWVVLVVDILNKEYDAGDKHHLRERLRELPGDLHELFRDIMTRDSKHQHGLLLCIQWVLFAKQPLAPKQLYYAVISGFEPQYLADCHSGEISDDDIRRYILNKSKGLAEPTKSKSPTIQFIHESVRDFLLKEDGLSKVFPDLGANIPGQSHEALKHCCLTYMSMETLQAPKEFSRDAIIEEYPFLEYTNEGILHHANQAENYGVSQRGFLDGFPRSVWVTHYNILQKHKVRQYTLDVSLSYILAEAGMPALVCAQPGCQSCFEVENERYGLPILAAKSRAVVQVMLEAEAARLADFSFRDFCRELPPTLDTPGTSSRIWAFNIKKDLFQQLVERGHEVASLFFLATKKCDVKLKDKRGKTALMYAAENEFLFLIKELLRRGADISAADKNGRTPLHSASTNGHVEMAKLLIDRGANVSTADKDGCTPLHWASTEGHVEIAKLLIDRGADILTADKDGWTPLHLASTNGHVEIAELLIDRGADILTAAKDGCTPLLLASTWGHVEIAKLLIDRGANVSTANKNGWTPLHWASIEGYVKIANLLIDRGADILTANKNGRTPLHLASTNGHVEIAKLLIDRGADILTADKNGRTPLHLASTWGYVEMAKLLIDRGADSLTADKNGWTPLHLASTNGHVEMAKLISEYHLPNVPCHSIHLHMAVYAD